MIKARRLPFKYLVAAGTVGKTTGVCELPRVSIIMASGTDRWSRLERDMLHPCSDICGLMTRFAGNSRVRAFELKVARGVVKSRKFLPAPQYVAGFAALG